MTTNSNQSSPADAHLKSVLVIEDEGEMCLLLNLILENKALNISHVKDLASATVFLQQEKPDLILLDNRLPDGIGFDFIGYVKTHCPSAKIIVISGVDKAAGQFALEIGADAFLSKPFTKATLLESVNKLLN